MARGSSKQAPILDSAERLMLDEGYAAVTYRGVAAAAGVVPGLVQYYFPSQDELFIALLQRNTDRIVAQVAEAAQAEQPLRAIWNYASNPAGALMLMEFMALAHHHKAVAAEMGRGGERVRRAQLRTLKERWHAYGLDESELTPASMLFVLNAIPRMIALEEAFGTHIGHAETVRMVEHFLDRVEPKKAA